MSLRYFTPTPDMVPFFARGMGSHLVPLLDMAAHKRCHFASLDQRRPDFGLRLDKPLVVIIGDDPSEPQKSLGPPAFHRESVKALFEHAFDLSLISCEIIPDFYVRAAALASIGFSSVIIETRSRHDPAWTRFANRYGPGKLRSTGRVHPKWRTP